MTSTTEAEPKMATAEGPPARGPKKIVIGVCAMKRKATSKPMREIMAKIAEYYGDWLEFAVFPEDVIMNEPVEQWPLCDCLISFHATDFPLLKAIEYERLRRPYVINDLHRQFDLLDRRKVFRTLARAGIEHPRHGVLIRNPETGEEGQLVDNGDTLEVNGMVFTKPFVEKSISAEDHNIYIYYPSSVGGGSQRLFRKINNRSSYYSPISTVRQDGSYIYEDFIPADGTDVKVYAVGPYYAHAEARKAPGLDGKVERDSHGKEVRYPVILTNKEKMIARRVVMAFGQTVCGFDLLRANGKSFVCDVNGFSFVKSSTKYYEDTAKILGNMILRRLAYSLSIPWQMPFQADDPPLVATPGGKIMELRCVLAVIRHGDRTPKQKMKLVVNDERLFTLFDKYEGHKKGEIKMKKPTQLEEVLHLAREMLHEHLERRNDILKKMEASEETADIVSPTKMGVDLEHELDVVEESIKKWDQVRAVLEMYGHFSGINRKVQLKYLKARQRPSSDSDEITQGPALLLIIKWGGELTTAGVLQAEALGKLFRTLYPGIQRTDGKGDAEDTQGLGFLRLHSTYRHDLKIYSSDEGRVQMTAAAFARGLLALEGELTPILVQMVKSANTDGLLDDDCNARQFQTELKSFLHSALQVDRDWTLDDYEKLNPLGMRSINNALEFIKNPHQMCEEISGYVQRMVDIIHWHKMNRPNRTLYLSETWDLAERRWTKELRELRRVNKNGDVEFDISKIPDIYDNIKYDMEHNPDLCINMESEFERMYLCVKNMADIVVPQEYGIRKEGKLSVAQRVCAPLLAKIRSDLHRCIECSDEDESSFRLDPRASQGIATPYRHVRTRLYFTSESHIHSLMNLIRWGGLCDPNDKKWQRAMNFLSGVTEFNYMTQMVLMVYEDTRDNTNKQGIDRFHVELLFSPGLYPCFQTEKERIYEGRYGSGKPPVPQPASVSPRQNNSGSDASIGSVGGGKPAPDSPSVDMKPAAAVGNKELPKGKSCKVAGDVSAAESEDELADVSTVNLVALDEITAKQSTYTNEDLARHSPTQPKSPTSPRPQRKRHMTAEHEKSAGPPLVGNVPVGIIKSFSDVSCSVTNLQDFDDDYDTIERSSTEESGLSRRSRFPYRFKHHTVNLLTEVDNRLISTDVIRGKNLSGEESRRKTSSSPAVLSTAVIARSSSAPRLQTYKAEDEIAVNEIRRFWPPLRSLETLHDNLSFKQFDDFLQRLMNIRTPMPSPPRTPIGSISRENSDLYSETTFPTPKPSPTSPDRTLCDTARRLSLMEE